MAQVINTNILSLNAQRNLTNSAATLQTSLQRLSSGLRINSAKDDAAGLAISERFTTQIRGMNQAIRNANDGISLAQVGEGALGEVSNNLQRIRELAVQARNATNSTADREALNREVQQRIEEIQRVATQTEFNGTKLLDGNFAGQTFQVGANVGETITVADIANAQTNALGEWEFGGGFARTFDFAGATTTNDGAGADQRFGYDAASFSIGDNDFTVAALTATGADPGPASGTTTEALAQEALAQAVADAINAQFDGAAVRTGTSLTITLDGAFTISDSSANISGLNGAGVALPVEENVGFAGETVLTAAAADRMMTAMDAALTAVNDARAQLGAVQNRFESVVANLSSAVENLSASRSRILDTDFAAETAALTRGQILQQAGIAMLSQANAAPQSVLNLLR